MKQWSRKLRLLSCRQRRCIGGQNICWAQWLLLVVFFVIFLTSCGGGEGPGEEAGKIATSVAETVAASGQPPVADPADDATAAPPAPEEPVPDGGDEAPTVEEPVIDIAATEAAQQLADVAATEAAAATAADAELAATLEPIRAEVATYGVDPSGGNLGFTHPPVSIEENDFEDVDWKNQNILTVARDFVLAADVTWNSAFAESGCGFAVRSDGDEENPSQYLVGLTRGAQGHVLFAEQVTGDVDLNLVTDIYANGIDPQFEWQNDTTNRLAIVGRGQEFTIYSNGTRLGTITGTAGFEEGFVAFFALNRSGGIRCDFDNAWLWRMN